MGVCRSTRQVAAARKEHGLFHLNFDLHLTIAQISGFSGLPAGERKRQSQIQLASQQQWWPLLAATSQANAVCLAVAALHPD